MNCQCLFGLTFGSIGSFRGAAWPYSEWQEASGVDGVEAGTSSWECEVRGLWWTPSMKQNP